METLFDPEPFDNGAKKRKPSKRKTNADSVVEPTQPGWWLIATKQGVIGHHKQKNRTKHNSIVAMCDVVGHPVGDGRTETMVRCAACQKEMEKGLPFDDDA